MAGVRSGSAAAAEVEASTGEQQDYNNDEQKCEHAYPLPESTASETLTARRRDHAAGVR